MVCDIEAGEQAPPTSSVSAMVKPMTAKTQEVPPNVISEQKSWVVSRYHIQQRHIQMKRCVIKRDGIQIHPSRIDDHRTITQILDKESQEYHTFKLPEENTLKVVLRGIPQMLSTLFQFVNVFRTLGLIQFRKTVVGTRHKIKFLINCENYST